MPRMMPPGSIDSWEVGSELGCADYQPSCPSEVQSEAEVELEAVALLDHRLWRWDCWQDPWDFFFGPRKRKNSPYFVPGVC